MSKADEHNRLIADAAKVALIPLGCRRVGRSRTWISDQGYWVIQIEFQPSGWAKGSYLNVGAAWLWYVRKGLPFNVGYRVEGFIAFENAEQFSPLVAQMATRAAQEVQALKTKFKTFEDVLDYLVHHIAHDGWPVYHAAVAMGLAGEITASKELFRRLEAWRSNGTDWEQKLKSDSVALAHLLEEPAEFRRTVLRIIGECRALNGLPRDPHCLESIGSSIVAH
jgi:hypothetical protein